MKLNWIKNGDLYTGKLILMWKLIFMWKAWSKKIIISQYYKPDKQGRCGNMAEESPAPLVTDFIAVKTLSRALMGSGALRTLTEWLKKEDKIYVNMLLLTKIQGKQIK